MPHGSKSALQDAVSSLPNSSISVSRQGAAAILVLDRPKALNALSNVMKAEIARRIPEIARNPDIYAVVIMSTGSQAFCAGGDVIELATLAREQPKAALQCLADEYALIWLLECFSKPVVSLINGLVMGSGAGITLANTHRVAGENYTFAMPEAAIGFFPDAGVAHILARLPDNIGVYLGLTGRRVHRADAFQLGLVTHCIASNQFESIITELATAAPIDPVLDRLHEEPREGPLQQVRAQIAHCFAGHSIGEIATRLEATPTEHRGWAAAVLDDLARGSPMALAISLRHIREAQTLDRRQVLIRDYRIGCRLILAADFQQGVRARLLSPDHFPIWHPTHSSAVSTAMVDRAFIAQTGCELTLPTRQEMQAMRI